MPRDRFKAILKFLRFDDSATRDERIKEDKLAPISAVFNSLNKSLKQTYTPGTVLTIDEHMARF